MVKNDPLRSQPIEVRRLDPGVPISPDEPKMQAVADDDDYVHELFRVNCDWDYRRPGKGSSEASSGSGRGIKYPFARPRCSAARKRFLGLLEQNGKAFLLKMIIIRQNFVDTLLPHGFHRNAVGQAVMLVGPGIIKSKASEEGLPGLRVRTVALHLLCSLPATSSSPLSEHRHAARRARESVPATSVNTSSVVIRWQPVMVQ